MSEKLSIGVSGMTCVNCVRHVEDAIKSVPGVMNASVNLSTEQAVFEYQPDVATIDAISAAIRDAGYSPIIESTIEENISESQTSLKRDLVIAVSLTVPELLLSMIPMMIPAMHHAMMILMPEMYWHMIELALTTPVLFFAGIRFFRIGFAEIRHLSLGMNTLVMMGSLSAYLYSVAVMTIPSIFPAGTDHIYFEAAAVIVTLILLGKFLEGRSKGETSDAIRRLIRLQPKQARVMINGEMVDVDISQIVRGDVIVVRPGEKIAVDGKVVEGVSWIDESMITGESMPVEKSIGSEVIGGTINKNGTLSYEAMRVGSETVLAQIVEMVQNAQLSKPPIQQVADKIAAIFVPVVLGLATLTFIGWYFWGPDPSLNFAFVAAMSVLVIACPCAMGLATPTAIMVGTGKGAELGILYRRGAAMESLAKADIAVLDKTGTITMGSPAVTGMMLFGFEEKEILILAASVEGKSEHPVGRAVVTYASDKGVGLENIETFKTTPGYGVEAVVSGKSILLGSKRLMEKSGIETNKASVASEKFENNGNSLVWIAVDGELAAIFAISDPVKDGSKDAVRHLKRMGFQVEMLTGDGAKAANNIGREVGIDKVVAEVLPGGKAAEIKRLQDEGRKVLFVGDGINDSPALAQADVGVAIGTGTDIAIETADVILMSGDLMGLVNTILLARKTLKTIKLNFLWAYLYNIALIPVAAGALYSLTGSLLNPMLAAAAMSISSLFVVTNSLRLKGFKGLLPQ